MSLESQGAAPPVANPSAAEDRFQGLWDAGAFNADGKPDPAQGQVRAETPAPQPAPNPAPDPAPEPAPQVAAAEEEGPDYANVEDYLQKAGIERESFLSLPISVTIGGKTSQIPLKDALRSYQQEGDYTRKMQDLSSQRTAWEAQQTQARQALEAQLNQAQALGNLAHQQLLADYQGIDWNKLRATDPAQWAVMNQDFQMRAGAIQQHLAQVQQAQQQQALQQQQEFAKQLPVERDRMFEQRPEWRDTTKFEAARSEMSAYARKLGFTEAEIGSIFDHRYMLALHDASRFAALQAQAPQAAKRVRAAPQMANPGARISRDPTAVARNQARERFQKNPRDQDAQAAYFSTFS